MIYLTQLIGKAKRKSNGTEERETTIKDRIGRSYSGVPIAVVIEVY
ncbi:MAG: hypothetical protein ACJ718_04780 [Nitrososphaeraceae archaeon]